MEWAHVSVGEDALDFCPKCMVEILTVSPWIPIEEAELINGEMYDTYSIEYGRMPDCRLQISSLDGNERWFESKFLRPRLLVSQVTHIMKRPADPEI